MGVTRLLSVFHAFPLFLPAIAVTTVVGIRCCRALARPLRTSRAVAFALVLSLGGILALTLLPDISPAYFGYHRLSTALVTCTTHQPLQLPSLTTVNERSLNVALFVPLGVTAAFLSPKLWPLCFALPFGIEAVQYGLPWLMRTCDAQDVVSNIFGLTLGLAVGVFGRGILLAARSRRRQGPHPARNGCPTA